MEQRELAERLLRRDEIGVEELLQHYEPLMKYIITPILPDPRNWENYLSGAALRVWERIGQFDGERGGWATWLTALTWNTALNRTQNNTHHGGEALSEQTPSQEPGPKETVLRRGRRATAQWALEKLPAGNRALLYRKYYYRQSTAQITVELGLIERVVEGKLHRLKKGFRESLGEGDHAGT